MQLLWDLVGVFLIRLGAKKLDNLRGAAYLKEPFIQLKEQKSSYFPDSWRITEVIMCSAVDAVARSGFDNSGFIFEFLCFCFHTDNLHYLWRTEEEQLKNPEIWAFTCVCPFIKDFGFLCGCNHPAVVKKKVANTEEHYRMSCLALKRFCMFSLDKNNLNQQNQPNNNSISLEIISMIAGKNISSAFDA